MNNLYILVWRYAGKLEANTIPVKCSDGPGVAREKFRAKMKQEEPKNKIEVMDLYQIDEVTTIDLDEIIVA